MRVVKLAAEDDFDGWRAAARALLAGDVPADQIIWQVGDQATDLFAGAMVQPSATAALKVHKEFVQLANRVILHRDPERFSLLYGLLRRVIHHPHVLFDKLDPRRRRIEALSDTIRRDMHKMRAFLRFREVQSQGRSHYVAWFEPEHHIVRANASFFVDRFTSMDWSILSPEISIHWDGHKLRQGPGATLDQAASGDPVEEIWKSYFSAIFNPTRLNPRAMMREMPKKYWKNMPEAALVPDLISNARAREIEMIERSKAKNGRVAKPSKHSSPEHG